MVSPGEIYDLNYLSLIGKVAFLCCHFQAFLSLGFRRLSFPRFLWVYAVWGSLCFLHRWVYAFCQFGNCSAIIFLKYFFSSTFSPLSGTLMTWMLDLFVTDPQVLLLGCCLYSYWVISILSLSPWFFSSTLLFSPSSEIFIFQLSNFHLILLFLCWDFFMFQACS